MSPDASPDLTAALSQAADAITQADALLITAGAGMGIDSGLPDFRGKAGFWAAYPALGRRRLRFQELASPERFERMPELAWGFYGHRLQMYRATDPHAGFGILRRWAAAKPHGAFVFTSNVDGQFQKAGFDAGRVVECHGSLQELQCMAPCREMTWSADDVQPWVNEAECRWLGPLPQCPWCGKLARPNVLMFEDWHWIHTRSQMQRVMLDAWLERTSRPVLIELGAGSAIATVRHFGESVAKRLQVPLLRINPTEPGQRLRHMVQLPLPALAALQALDGLLASRAGT